MCDCFFSIPTTTDIDDSLLDVLASAAVEQSRLEASVTDLSVAALTTQPGEQPTSASQFVGHLVAGSQPDSQLMAGSNSLVSEQFGSRLTAEGGAYLPQAAEQLAVSADAMSTSSVQRQR
jgi:hypothetical protein